MDYGILIVLYVQQKSPFYITIVLVFCPILVMHVMQLHQLTTNRTVASCYELAVLISCYSKNAVEVLIEPSPHCTPECSSHGRKYRT